MQLILGERGRTKFMLFSCQHSLLLYRDYRHTALVTGKILETTFCASQSSREGKHKLPSAMTQLEDHSVRVCNLRTDGPSLSNCVWVLYNLCMAADDCCMTRTRGLTREKATNGDRLRFAYRYYVSSSCLDLQNFASLLLIDPSKQTVMLCRNVRNELPSEAASHPRRTDNSRQKKIQTFARLVDRCLIYERKLLVRRLPGFVRLSLRKEQY
jgi:hypothetical protein